MRSSRSRAAVGFVLLLTVIAIYWLTTTTSDPPEHLLREITSDPVIQNERVILAASNAAQYGDFSPSDDRWLNITGFNAQEGFAWSTLNNLKARAETQLVWTFGKDIAAALLNGTSRPDTVRVHQDINGYVSGRWVRSPLDYTSIRPELNLTHLLPAHEDQDFPFYRNITGVEGKISISLKPSKFVDEFNGTRSQGFAADVTIADDESAGDGWAFRMYGVNIMSSGSILLTTTSHKFNGIFGLPNFALSSHRFSLMQQQLNSSITRVIDRQVSQGGFGPNPWSSGDDEDNPYARQQCDIVMYLQQAEPGIWIPPPPWHPSSAELAEWDTELQNPLGRPHPAGSRTLRMPKMKMIMLAWSPDCGWVLESRGNPDHGVGITLENDEHLVGDKEEVFALKAGLLTMFFAVMLTAQTRVLAKQMVAAQTPSGRSRISVYSILDLSLADGFICMTLLAVAIGSHSNQALMLAVAFLSFLNLTFFDLKFMSDLWTVQVQERRRQRIQRARSQSTYSGQDQSSPSAPTGDVIYSSTETRSTGDVAGELPLPVSATRPTESNAVSTAPPTTSNEATEQVAATGQVSEAANLRSQTTGLYMRFYLLMFSTVFLSINAMGWYPRVRAAYANLLVFVYLSWMIPQIYRNAMRNCRKALLWKFVIWQSIFRLLPILYIWGVPNNIFDVKIDLYALATFIVWTWIQVWALTLQNLFGPRLFVPESWVPKAYDYHPVLRQDQEDSLLLEGSRSFPVGDHDDTRSSDDKSKRIFDCAICMQDVEVPVVTNSDTVSHVGASFISRRAYMVTPCRHIFHTQCLEEAMRYRLQCPVCRETLPPL